MPSILENFFRVGCFSSSEIYNLSEPGKRPMTEDELKARPKSGTGSSAKTIEDPSILSEAAMTYIEEKNMERRHTRSLNNETFAKPTTWGKALEGQCFDRLGTAYQIRSNITLRHATIPYWVGSPDDVIESDELTLVGDIKCPMTLKSFSQLVDPMYSHLQGIDAMNALRFGWTDLKGVSHKKHSDGNKYYWQLISNAVLTNSDYAELVVYVPYKDELDSIRDAVFNTDEDQNHFKWIYYSLDSELPYLTRGGFYNDVNTIRFRVPQEDKKHIERQILAAGKYLITTQEYETWMKEKESSITG